MIRHIFQYFIFSSGTDTFFFFLTFFQALIGRDLIRLIMLTEIPKDCARSCFPWSITSTPPLTRARLSAPSPLRSPLSPPWLVGVSVCPVCPCVRVSVSMCQMYLDGKINVNVLYQLTTLDLCRQPWVKRLQTTSGSFQLKSLCWCWQPPTLHSWYRGLIFSHHC